MLFHDMPSYSKRMFLWMRTFYPEDAFRTLTRKVYCLASATGPATEVSEYAMENKKHNLLRAVQDTRRGLLATTDQGSSIEDALVDVEGCDAGKPIDLALLDGT